LTKRASGVDRQERGSGDVDWLRGELSEEEDAEREVPGVLPDSFLPFGHGEWVLPLQLLQYFKLKE
jgi:hypothetical protein